MTDGVVVYSPNRPDAIISLATSERTVALTFDDGPDPSITPRVLDLLERYGAHATFFVLGRQARENPGVSGRGAEARERDRQPHLRSRDGRPDHTPPPR